ncbi:hypothetical protein DOX54_13550 [Cronobacter sakazakii]|nr:hypothetical protein [Cronobacter sakazakii]
MSTISNDRIQQIMTRCVPFHGECAAPVSVIEVKAMATELLALRKEREKSEPAYYLNQIDYGDGEGFELRAYFRELDAMKSKDDFGGVVIPAYTAPPATDKVAETAVCPKCGNTGLADSGGVQPWGEPILIECDCTAPPAPVVPDDDQSRQAYENHVRSRYQYPMLERHPEDGSPWQGEYKESARQMEWEDWQCSWNACRAAMLNQSQPVDETDTASQQFESLQERRLATARVSSVRQSLTCTSFSPNAENVTTIQPRPKSPLPGLRMVIRHGNT